MAQTDKNRYASELVPIELLQQPIDFPIATKIFAKNVIIKAPMTEMISTYDLNLPLKSGLPTEALINLYDKWNAGGAAVMVTGPMALTTRDLEGTGNMVVAKEVDTPLRRDLFKRLASTATHGTLIFAQLLHPGRMAIKTSPEFKAVDMNKLSVDELKEIVERYVFAARFTKDCGFNGVEINVSMDFALAQLVAAESNQRTDQYGGSLANRTRILFDVINGIRDDIKDDDNFVVGLKLHSLNFEQQFEEKQFAEFCKRLD
ncbi:unnamed protein product, partial [Anisakis simplex]|uniref:Oxidored_FMN domain-containing protein n=1 Tax=Anisakis simplex TaxID=6269 RepID=A0A0M3K9R0_ANISI